MFLLFAVTEPFSTCGMPSAPDIEFLGVRPLSAVSVKPKGTLGPIANGCGTVYQLQIPNGGLGDCNLVWRGLCLDD